MDRYSRNPRLSSRHFGKRLASIGFALMPLQAFAQNCWDTTRPDSQYAVDTANGTVTDNATGLMWKRCVEGASGASCGGGTVVKSWPDAVTLAASAFATFTDWRLPSLDEYASLVASSCVNGPVAPPLNQAVFPAMPASSYWSSNVNPANTNNAFAYRFFSNLSQPNFPKTDTALLRRVRGLRTQTLSFAAPPALTITLGSMPSVLATSATPNSGNPVQYTSATPLVCTVAANGSVSLTASATAGNTCGIVANQAGVTSGAFYAAAASVTQNLMVVKASTATTITAHTPDPSQLGTPIAVTVLTVAAPAAAPSQPAPSGTVTVSDGAASCVVSLPAASCNLSPLTIGSKTLTASYAGDANFAASVSAGVTQQVNAYCVLDLDGSGSFNANTDGLIALRHLLGLSGLPLVNGALATNATVVDPVIIGSRIATMRSNGALDIDGDGSILPETDGLLLLRVLLGFTGTSVTQGITSNDGRLRPDWPLIRSYLNSACNLNLP